MQKKNSVMVCKECSNGDIILPIGRLQYPSLVEPTQYQGEGAAKYRATIIFSDDADLSLLEERIAQRKKEAGIKKQAHEAIRADKDNEDAGFGEGARFINTTANRVPIMIDLNRERLDPACFYAGCFVRASINLYISKVAKGVRPGLQAIQFVRDGEPLMCGGSSDLNEFDDLDENDLNGF